MVIRQVFIYMRDQGFECSWLLGSKFSRCKSKRHLLIANIDGFVNVLSANVPGTNRGNLRGNSDGLAGQQDNNRAGHDLWSMRTSCHSLRLQRWHWHNDRQKIVREWTARWKANIYWQLKLLIVCDDLQCIKRSRRWHCEQNSSSPQWRLRNDDR